MIVYFSELLTGNQMSFIPAKCTNIWHNSAKQGDAMINSHLAADEWMKQGQHEISHLMSGPNSASIRSYH